MSRARSRSRARGHARAAAAAFLPTSLSGLTAWLRADLGVTADGSNLVSLWADQSGNGRDFSQATGSFRPTLLAADGPNGTPAIDFDGTNDILADSAASNFVTASAYTCFTVFRADAISTSAGDALAYENDGPWGESSGNVALLLRNAPSNQALVYNWDGSSDVVALSCATATWHACEQRHEGGALYGRLHGTAEASVASGATAALAAMIRLGSVYATSAQYFDGAIAEVMWWNRALTLPERQQVRAYLTARYGLAWS